VDDGKLGTDEGVVSITVNPVNDSPDAFGQTVNLYQDTTRLIVMSGSDLETNPAFFSYAIETGPAHGTLDQESSNTWWYTPDAGYVGDDTFTFTGSDRGDPDGSMAGVLTSDPAEVLITVLPVNHAPDLAAIGDIVVNEGTSVSFYATATDQDAGDTSPTAWMPVLQGQQLIRTQACSAGTLLMVLHNST